jgi:hypothetical protein
MADGVFRFRQSVHLEISRAKLAAAGILARNLPEKLFLDSSPCTLIAD